MGHPGPRLAALCHSARVRAGAGARAIAAALLVLLWTSLAQAHVIGVSLGDYTPRGAEVDARIALRTDEAALAVPALDGDGDGRVTPREIQQASDAIAAAFVAPLEIRADDGPACAGRFDSAEPDAADGMAIHATFRVQRAAPLHALHLRFGFLDRLPSTHRHLATVHLPGADVEQLVVLARPSLDVPMQGGGSTGFGSLLRGGVEHILTGADHLAFLLALVLGATLAKDRALRVRSLVAVLTAFTVGHSALLAVATLGGFAPASRWVEPLVALSVAYVGIENLWASSLRHRWVVTLLFGFVHGFAFAGGLLPLGLPRARLPVALVAFNLGVEAGQLAVLAVALPLLAAARRSPRYPQAAKAASLAITAVALVWLVQRIVSPRNPPSPPAEIGPSTMEPRFLLTR